jgi:AbrB family looped-hinge helix DNA binding protein
LAIAILVKIRISAIREVPVDTFPDPTLPTICVKLDTLFGHVSSVGESPPFDCLYSTTLRGDPVDRAVKIDAQGRVAIPAAMRTWLGLEVGDTVFVHLDEEAHGVRLAKAINRFDLLYEHAVRDYRAGKTTNLRDFLPGEIDEPDGDTEYAIRDTDPGVQYHHLLTPLSGRSKPPRTG